MVVFTSRGVHHEYHHVTPQSQRLQPLFTVRGASIFARDGVPSEDDLDTDEVEPVNFQVAQALGFVMCENDFIVDSNKFEGKLVKSVVVEQRIRFDFMVNLKTAKALASPSLAQPGTNFTGLSNQSVELTVKRLELLKEIVPGAAPVAVLWDPASLLSWPVAETAARQRGWKLLSFEVRDAGEIEAAVKAASDARAGALLPVGGLVFRHARRIAELAARSRLPALYSNRVQVGDEGLISYGADINEIWRRAAVYVDKILKGARPADLPVEQPTRFEMVINLKTAKALGLTIPQSLLLRADKVIQ